MCPPDLLEVKATVEAQHRALDVCRLVAGLRTWRKKRLKKLRSEDRGFDHKLYFMNALIYW